MNTTEHYLLQNLVPIESDIANQEQEAVLAKGKATAGFIPNMYKGMANLPGLLDTYLHGYDQFRKYDGFTSAEQEVVLLAISLRNGCDYCTAAHSTLAVNHSGVPENALNAIRFGEPIEDERLAAVYAITVEVNDNRGRPNPEVVSSFLEAGFTEMDLLAIVLAASVKLISNYSNHLFDTEVDKVFSAYKIS